MPSSTGGIPIPQELLAHASERFWAKVQTGPAGCWEWKGAIKPNGYGMFSVRMRGKQHHFNAHRWAYSDAVGPIPSGTVLDHLCRNRACVRPDHLEATTQSINLRRGVSFNGSKSTCKNGHSLADAKPRRRGGRRCRTCHNLSEKARYERRRAA